ncbi:hypothetical protein [Amycolatopsis lurida]|nr:hypothetical protein [Amycolatopsis lurida]
MLWNIDRLTMSASIFQALDVQAKDAGKGVSAAGKPWPEKAG